MAAAAEVSIRELRNHGSDVTDRIERGGQVIATRSGRRVGELRPLGRSPLPVAALVERRRRPLEVDPGRLRRDVSHAVADTL